MKKAYDFSKGERGKFHRPHAVLNIPVYLDVDVLAFVQGIAKKRKTEVSTTVNDLLRGHMRLVATTK